MVGMRRREVISLLGGAATWPLAAHAQQSKMPVIGLLSGFSASAPMAGFHQGLKDAGFVEGQNLAFEARFADGQYDLLPALAAELVNKRVTIIATIGALIIANETFFFSQIGRLAALASRHSVPAIGPLRAFVDAGGLLSYGASIPEVLRQSGIYTGRVLKGTNPATLPVVQPAKFELVINLKTAKALGLTVPLTLQASADEVIE